MQKHAAGVRQGGFSKICEGIKRDIAILWEGMRVQKSRPQRKDAEVSCGGFQGAEPKRVPIAVFLRNSLALRWVVVTVVVGWVG